MRAGVGGCLDEGPAKVAGSLLGERAAEVAFAGLVDAWAEAAVAGQLARRCKAADVAELGGDRVGEHPADPGDGAEQRDVAVLGAEAAQLALALVDLPVELVDQAQAGLDRALPRLRQAEVDQQLAAADAEQIRDGTGLAVGEQDRVHALLQARAMPDEVQPPASPLALGAHSGSGSQIAGTRSRRASSASTQASIRSVLHASGASPFTFCASAISTCQPASSSR